MKLAMGTVIREQRRALHLTQEQLAEAMGVSVGAVSKWENDTTTPDLPTVVALAELFSVSADVLLGHTVQDQSAARLVREIKRLCGEKNYAEGCSLAERALLRWPNHMKVLFHSANLYLNYGMEQQDTPALHRALELFERCRALIGQSDDERITPETLELGVVWAYCGLGRNEEALCRLKRHNGNGVNSDFIGALLVEERRFDEAKEYLSEAMLERGTSLVNIAAGLAACFEDAGQYGEADAILDWVQTMLEKLELPGRNSPLVYIRAWLLFLRAGVQAHSLGDEAAAEDLLRRAVAAARRFDADPVYTPRGIRFYCGSGNEVATFGPGAGAMQVLERGVSQSEKQPTLRDLWEKVVQNEA